MIELSLDRLTIENFKSITGTPVILDLQSLPIGLHYLRGVNKVHPRLGSNGAGKTTLWDALSWCWYGRTPRGQRAPNLRPHGASPDTMTVRAATRIDKRLSTIARSVPGGLTINGVVVGQEQVDRLLGISFDTFCHTVLLAQGEPLFFDLKPAEKMALLSQVLELERWDERSSIASRKVSSLKLLQMRLEGEATGLDAQIRQTQALTDRCKDDLDSWERDRQTYLKSDKKKLDALNKGLDLLTNEWSQAESAFDMASTELKGLVYDLRKHETTRTEALRKSDHTEQFIAQAVKREAAIYHELNDLKAKRCPVCGQPTKGATHTLAEHRKALLNEQTDLQRNVTRERKTLKTVKAELARLTTAIDNMDKAEKQFRAKMEKSEASEQALRTRLLVMKVDIKQIKVTNERLEEQDNPHRAQLAHLRKVSKKLTVDLRELRDRIDRLSSQIERTQFWIKGFRDVRLYLIEDALQDLQLVANTMLPEVGLDGWNIEYAIERETKSGTMQRGITVSIVPPDHNNPISWDSWSGGEGQRLRIIGALALSDVLLARAGVRCNLSVLDESSKYLSGSGVRELIEFLAMRARNNRQHIWYVDHATIESNHFASVTRVIRDREGTSIIQTS